eukprot:CAMPEP_0185575978 /NCGR_PEP_ID=MMETSP0434-20130131/7020_1 /TAXON_ID=626734 ORGANISM="Favella taraikaensis, Strain Fe Narragansett Bay" /NCGR_SAMPLE_ID=MMETSP0434 /ASSEMBLY_ACC=CAM_ASM_000379 /LENGTH=76 /DNA_ID=CAMNT_0028193019 /DNA_START=722 /DNA_END=952 /DNA_ORIENTATION=+
MAVDDSAFGNLSNSDTCLDGDGDSLVRKSSLRRLGNGSGATGGRDSSKMQQFSNVDLVFTPDMLEGRKRKRKLKLA